jgi:hypothetical protein
MAAGVETEPWEFKRAIGVAVVRDRADALVIAGVRGAERSAGMVRAIDRRAAMMARKGVMNVINYRGEGREKKEKEKGRGRGK